MLVVERRETVSSMLESEGCCTHKKDGVAVGLALGVAGWSLGVALESGWIGMRGGWRYDDDHCRSEPTARIVLESDEMMKQILP